MAYSEVRVGPAQSRDEGERALIERPPLIPYLFYPHDLHKIHQMLERLQYIERISNTKCDSNANGKRVVIIVIIGKCLRRLQGARVARVHDDARRVQLYEVQRHTLRILNHKL